MSSSTLPARDEGDADTSALPRIRHLVVVTGASGAGKSTFLKVLASGKMQAEVKAMLPLRAETWIQYAAGQHQRWLPELAKLDARDTIPGLVLHYDIRRGLKTGGYQFDPSLRLLQFADAVTVVHLKPPPERLASQLTYCETVERPKPAVLGKLIWRAANLIRSVLLGIKQIILPRHVFTFMRWRPLSRTWERINRQAGKSPWSKLAQYSQPNWLDKLYERWEAYIGSLARDGFAIEQIYLQPDLDGQIGKVFRWQPWISDGSVSAIQPERQLNRE